MQVIDLANLNFTKSKQTNEKVFNHGVAIGHQLAVFRSNL